MIAFKVSLNGKRVCTAGAEDLGVLSTIISACGKPGKKSIPYRPNEDSRYVSYSVGGLTSRGNGKQDFHLNWKSAKLLKVGDVVQVEVLETKTVDRAKSRKKKSSPPKATES
jgi:hypothetical protein